MLRSLYIAGTGMSVQREKMNVLTNNAANAETTGYKADQLLSRSFEDLLIEYENDPSVVSISDAVGLLNTGVHIDQVYTDFTQGSIEETGVLTDLALEGDGFFTISTSDGLRYTRDGSFTVNSQGYLVTSEGNYVQGQNGKIYVGTDSFSVDSEGNIAVDGTVVDQLKIVTFDDLSGLRKDGSNLYVNYTEQAVLDSDATVSQGYLEGSNVDVTSLIVDMMELSRTYELNQRMVTMIDESLEKTVNEVGKV